MAADCAPVKVNYSDDEMMKIQANGANSVYIKVLGRRIRCFELGRDIHNQWDLKGYVTVKYEGYGRFCAKFASQRDYDIVTQTSYNKYWFHGYSIEIYGWSPNFQFGKAPLLAAGDMVEARLEGLPSEYRMVSAVAPIANAVCEPLDCHVSAIDTSNANHPRFWFKLNHSSGYNLLPLHVQLPGGLLVGLTYSTAKQCNNCRRFGYVWKTCPEPRQWSRSPNRSSSGPAQAHRPPPRVDPEQVPILADEIGAGVSPPPRVDPEQVPILDDEIGAGGSPPPRVDPEQVPILADEIGAGVSPPNPELRKATSPVSVNCFPTSSICTGASTSVSNIEMRDMTFENGRGESSLQTLEPESQESVASAQEEITPMEPFSVEECYALCSDRSSKMTFLPKTEMTDPVVGIVENDKERWPTWFDLGEKASRVDVALRVIHLNDEMGTWSQMNVTSHTGNAPAGCSKGLVYTSIQDAGDRDAIRKLRDTCNQESVSMAVVLDKSSVLVNDDLIIRRFGFSASHRAEMIFRSFREDGTSVNVKGSCLLMWKSEELCVDVWDVWCSNTELLSQDFTFSASWVVG